MIFLNDAFFEYFLTSSMGLSPKFKGPFRLLNYMIGLYDYYQIDYKIDSL